MKDAIRGEVKHSPTPWHIDEHEDQGSPLIRTQDRKPVLAFSQNDGDAEAFWDIDQADTEFIVRAVNAHDALLAGCKDALELMADDYMPLLAIRLRAAIDQAEAC